MIDPFNYQPRGDKKNSDYFNEYRMKIYERRKQSGLEDLFGDMSAVVIQVQTGDALPYLTELYLMSPYRFLKGFINPTHKIYLLKNKEQTPLMIIMEPLNPDYEDDLTRLNRIYPNARKKYNARYVGEIYSTQDRKETRKILESQDFRFHDASTAENLFYYNQHFDFTRLSDQTGNCIGYCDDTFFDVDQLDLGQPFFLTNQQQAQLTKAEEFVGKHQIKPLIKGIDHMATRILAGEREDAILEFLCLSGYYFWGAYNISDMNSSTNVNRAKHGKDLQSPAKVFTANNTPYMVNSFEGLPMPTENFVRNYGRRMHHIALEVVDGNFNKELKNIDHVVNTLRNDTHIDFLAKVFGECGDAPDLKQIFSKHSPYSLLITEYVERCHGFDGFFTKENVAALTEAAGEDEEVKTHHKQHGLIGD